jgi:hypothetical protein
LALGMGAATLACLAFIYYVVFPALHWSENQQLAQLSTIPYWLNCLIVLRAAVSEELLFRGYAIERLQELTGNLFIRRSNQLDGFYAGSRRLLGLGPRAGGGCRRSYLHHILSMATQSMGVHAGALRRGWRHLLAGLSIAPFGAKDAARSARRRPVI